MGEDGGIPVVSFLDACMDILPFLDIIGSTTVAPVKNDLTNNINVSKLWCFMKLVTTLAQVETVVKRMYTVNFGKTTFTKNNNVREQNSSLLTLRKAAKYVVSIFARSIFCFLY